MTDHDSGAKEQAEEGGAAAGAAANVVPFPRSWYGSVDELVPIDPRPPARSSDRASDASAFWGGDAPQAPVREEAPGARSGKTSPPRQIVTEWDDDEIELAGRGPDAPGGETAPDPTSPPDAAHGGARLRDGSLRGKRSPQRLPPALAAALVVLLVGILSAGALSGGPSPRHASVKTAERKPALTVTQTVPQTTTVVQTVTTSDRTPARHRHSRRNHAARVGEVPRSVVATPHDATRTTVPTTTVPMTPPQQAVTTPANAYHSSTPPPAPSDSWRGTYTPGTGGGTTPARSGSSNRGCAPSVTNGGACSL
jgi:hypothetical protein